MILAMLGSMEILIIAVFGLGLPLGLGYLIYRAGHNAGLAAGRKEALERLSGQRGGSGPH
jgi:hypothetical protein